MKINQHHQLSNKLDKCRRKLAAAKQRGDQVIILQAQGEIESLIQAIENSRALKTRELGNKSLQLQALAFSRELTKAEQADMGKLKKSIRGLVVVHPLTALGREMAVAKVTGFAPKVF